MPLYDYRCPDCCGEDFRIAGPDDHTALCSDCGGVMLRTDSDVWQPVFKGLQFRQAGETEEP